jgi:murein DD-endopeptidase MepM/ murein hydrolase activator NlpD
MEGHSPHHPECQYFHEGIDFALPCGTPIYAGHPCKVFGIDMPGYGPPGNSAVIWLAIYPQVQYDVWLYHMERYVVRQNDMLKAGDLIGYSGTRGWSTGCHIHFEVRKHNGAYRESIDPSFLLK